MSNAHFESSQRAFELAEAAGISTRPSSSKFVDKVFSWLELAPEQADVARRICSALERLLNRSHEDSRLVLQMSHYLQTFSGIPADLFQKKLNRSISYLEKPAASSLVKTIKQVTVADLSPKVLDLPDLDSIAILSQVPRDQITAIAGKPEMLLIGDEQIDLATTSRKEIKAAVKKVRSQLKAIEPQSEIELKVEKRPETQILEELDLPEDLEISTWGGDLEEATHALGNLLRNLPKQRALSNLAQVLEETKLLLESTQEHLRKNQARELPKADTQVELH